MTRKPDKLPFYINPARIQTVRLQDGWLTLDFDEGSVLKLPAKRAVSRFGTGETEVGYPQPPERLLTKGNKLVDGKPRCAKCNCLLTDDNRLHNCCLTCAMALECFDMSIETMTFCQVPNAAEKVMAYFRSLPTETDLTTVDTAKTLDALFALYRKDAKK